ncbi:MAG: hypothetical protein ACI4BD_01360 [Paludibacteraceae bacterium]
MKTNKLFSMLRVMAVAVCLGAAGTIHARGAADDAAPVITMHTNIYENAGANNQISLVIGAVEDMYLDVDCGFGKVEYELKAVPEDSTAGTLIYCTVDKNAIVRIYCDKPDAIVYINAEGCYLTSIDLTQLPNLDILNLNHNELEDLDLSKNTKLRALYVSDNPFTEATPLVVGDKPSLLLLEMPMVGYLDPNFDLTKYPELRSFDAYYTRTLRKIDPTQCPNLMQLTLEMTDVESVDVTKNPHLRILNVSETKVTELDLSQNKELLELYCTHVSGFVNKGAYKLKTLDVSNSRWLYRLNCAGNALTTLKFYHPTPTDSAGLVSLDASNNYLTEIDLSNQNYLNYVHIQNNCMDFVTLPLDSDVWQDYQYAQRDLPMEPAYKEGTTIDFSKRVLREGFLTDAIMYAIPMNTTDSFVLLDDSYYSFDPETGVVTLKKAYADSVVIEFSNSGFPVSDLFSEPFMIKTAAEYGQPTKVMSFTTYETSVSFAVGLHGATEENPITFWVDLGTQTLTPFVATSATTPVKANVSATKGYGPVAIYVPDGTNISALSIKDLYVSSIDLKQLNSLKELTLSNTSLYSIDLTYNRLLEVLDLSHNNLTTLNLEGETDYFNKNLLHTLDISYNSISNTGYYADNFKLSPLLAMLHFNAAHNQLGDIDFSDADNLVTLDVSDNEMERLDFQHCSSLDTVRASNNQLTEIILPEEDNIRYMDITDNLFTLANLPRHNDKLTEAGYLYAPQADIQIATMGPCADLSKQLVTINDQNTVLNWRKEDGTALVEGTDYSMNNGFTRFLDEELGTVYCEISHPAYPAFTGNKVLKTTKMLVAGMPTNIIATFVTANDSDAVSLSLAAAKAGTSVYFDWEGNGNVVQYLLGTTYRLFDATTYKGATVNVYTYEPTDTVSVFSISGATLTSFDGSKLLASTLTLRNAGLANLIVPENKNLLRELNLSGNALTDFPLSDFQNLYSVALSDNRLTTLDLSRNAGLGLVGAANNMISSVTLKNPHLWYLDLSVNELTAIQVDSTTVPNMQQLGLSYNYLHTLDVASLEGLKVLSIVANQFDFSTLPPILSQYSVYNYSNQAMLDVPLVDEKTIDLSTQAMVGDSATVFTWYLGEPVYNYDTYEWEGEVLIEGTEYTMENGVATFLKPFDDVICLLTNPAFPDVFLYTNYYDVLQSMQGISQTESATPTQVRKYMQNGVLIIEREGKTYTVLGETIE